MIEIKRSLYMNENTSEKIQSFSKVKNLMNQFTKKLMEFI